MTEKTAPKPKRETWLDWVAPVPADEAIARAQPLLTKEELLAALERDGVKATDRDLVFWQRRGVIPFPTKRRAGKTTIATYPSWMPSLIKALRAYQEGGFTLAQTEYMLRDLLSKKFGRALSPAGQEAVKRNVAYREFSRRMESIKHQLAEAVEGFETATNAVIGTVNVTFQPLTGEQLHEDLLTDIIRINLIYPATFQKSVEADGEENLFLTEPDMSGRMVEIRLGTVEKTRPLSGVDVKAHQYLDVSKSHLDESHYGR